jgi:hypothetical protein
MPVFPAPIGGSVPPGERPAKDIARLARDAPRFRIAAVPVTGGVLPGVRALYRLLRDDDPGGGGAAASGTAGDRSP